jgi:hypothetical protein
MSPLDPPFRAWVIKADSDLLNIANNLAAARVPWDTVCFHAQQAARQKDRADRVRQYERLRSSAADPVLAVRGAAPDAAATAG